MARLYFEYGNGSSGLASRTYHLPSGRTLECDGQWTTFPFDVMGEIEEGEVTSSDTGPAWAGEDRAPGRGAGRPVLGGNSYWSASGWATLIVADEVIPRLERLAEASERLGQLHTRRFQALAWTLDELQAAYGPRYTDELQRQYAA